MVSDREESDAEDDAIIPSAHMLKGSKQIQEAVDQRLKELTTLNKKGTFKSQRGGQEQIESLRATFLMPVSTVRYVRHH